VNRKSPADERQGFFMLGGSHRQAPQSLKRCANVVIRSLW
jgi:hypothetical protein